MAGDLAEDEDIHSVDGSQQVLDKEACVENSKAKRKRKRKRKQPDQHDKEDNESSGLHDPLKLTEQTVYVEGIPFDCSEDDVRHFFSSTLNLDDVVDLRLPKWQDSGRLRGFGHVVFRSMESRDHAIAASGNHYMKNRYVTIQRAKPPSTGSAISSLNPPRAQPENCRTVFCRNLPYTATKDDIEALFRPCGKIVEGGVRIAWNYKTRQSKGFCYIEFKHPEGAYAAVTKQPWMLQGRICHVDYDEGTIKGSYKTEGGRLWRKEFQMPQVHSNPSLDNKRRKGDGGIAGSDK
jgi:nucleolin